MSILSGDPLTQLAFSVYENKGVFALLLGSGLSRAAEIPTGWEIALDLIRRVALAQGTEDQPDWGAWYREQTGEEPSYSALLEELASSPDERRSILHSYIEPTPAEQEEGKKVPTAAHRAIAELVRAGYIRVIVTTNFDRLLENALREAHVEPTVIASPDALAGAEPFTHSACYILKLHGDYKDARIRNTDEELSHYSAEYDLLLDRIFDEFGLIVVGWSGEWDHALRAAFLRAPNRRYPVYWATRSALRDGAQQIVDQRAARLIEITDADSFLTAAWQRVQTLEHTHRQSPLSIELLVNSAKRYLGKPEYRIQLDELVDQETQRVISASTGPEFPPRGGWSEQDFRSRIARYEALAEPLAEVAGVLGRWGDGSELPAMLNVIRGIFSHTTVVMDGLTVWLNLRPYPAVLLFTSYGLGLVRAGRWSALHEFLTSQVTVTHDGPRRLVDELFLWAWEGGADNYWHNLEGLERRHTPLSDHLLGVFSEWSNSFIGVTPDFEFLYERFELLASLAYLETADEEELKASVEANNPQHWVWMPVGRSAWHGQIRERLIRELQDAAFRSTLVEAGFAKGRAEFIDIFVGNFKRIANRISWR